MQARILVVEDESDINQLIRISLEACDFNVCSVESGDQGYIRAINQHFDLIVLDIMLPGISGLEVCEKLRQENIFCPILMLTAKKSEADRVVGLEMGADDYLTKPFGVRELQARVKALLRRVQFMNNEKNQSNPENLIKRGALEIDIGKRRTVLNGNTIELTTKEFDLLVYLAEKPGQVYKRAELLDAVWGYQHAGYEHTVNSHINRLRSKLEREPADPQIVLTVWGVGYKFNDAIT